MVDASSEVSLPRNKYCRFFSRVYSAPETSIAPENGRLEDKPFLLEWPNIRGEMLVVISCTWMVLE